ncbi:MAG: MATE family efflux transporter [Erysipelotrichaceae bacterium]|nr:MATE family efflux transporter [Erysipelotrichaceae bacterium]MDY5253009.1 MATE family efflux transporter [Erysipelotrichaceae bacterium]
MQNDLGKDRIDKLVFAIAIPCMIAQFVNVLYSIIDRIYIGHIAEVGSLALAGIGVCGPVVTMIGAFASLIGVGGAPLCSIALGEKNHQKAQSIMANSFTLLLTISILLVISLFPFQEQMLYLFGASDATIVYAKSYFSIYLLGTPFALLSVGMNNFINCQGFAKTGMVSVLIGAIANIILDPIFIYTLDMGVAGAALATIIAQALSCLFVLSVLFKQKLAVNLHFEPLNVQHCLSILKIGFTQFIIIAFDNIMIIAMNMTLKHYGGEQADLLIMANTVAQSFMLLVTMPLGGISGGTQCILSYNYGAYQVERVKEAWKYIIKVCISFEIIMFLFAWVGGRYFVYLFTMDEQVILQSVKAIRIMTIFIIPLGMQYELIDGLTALGAVRLSLPLSFFRKGIYFIFLLIIPSIFGASSAFFAESISDLIAPFVSLVVVLRSVENILQWRLQMKPENFEVE